MDKFGIFSLLNSFSSLLSKTKTENKQSEEVTPSI